VDVSRTRTDVGLFFSFLMKNRRDLLFLFFFLFFRTMVSSMASFIDWVAVGVSLLAGEETIVPPPPPW